jgi:hypothetical protein
MTLFRSTSLFALLLAVAPAWAIQPFAADYNASWKGVQASARITLSQASGNRWNYELSIDNQLGSARQSTVFEERNGTFRPLSGVDTTQLLFKKSRKNATYDWAQHEARWSGDVKPDRVGPVKLQDGDLDGMLLNLAIVRDVAAVKRSSDDKQVIVWIGEGLPTPARILQRKDGRDDLELTLVSVR